MSKISYLQLLNDAVEEMKDSDLNWIETFDDFVLKLQVEINQKIDLLKEYVTLKHLLENYKQHNGLYDVLKSLAIPVIIQLKYKAYMGSIENLDKHTISKVFEKLGYVHPLTQLKELEQYSYKGNDLFLMTFQSELFNLYNNGTSLSSSSLLSIKGLVTLEDYLKLKNRYRGDHITISPNCKLGFVNGKCEPISSFGITLNKTISFSCRGDNIGLMKILPISSINELEGCKIEVN